MGSKVSFATIYSTQKPMQKTCGKAGGAQCGLKVPNGDPLKIITQ